MKQDFDSFFRANERRIYFQMRRLGISGDLYEEFYSEGVLALWKGYKQYDSKRGNFGTFLNYQIRYRLIDLIRKRVRDQERVDEAIQEKTTQIDPGNRHRATGLPIANRCGIVLENEAFWEEVRSELTNNQWKWVHYFIIADLTIKEIMENVDVSADAVKGWGRQVRRKLRCEQVRERLEELV